MNAFRRTRALIFLFEEGVQNAILAQKELNAFQITYEITSPQYEEYEHMIAMFIYASIVERPIILIYSQGEITTYGFSDNYFEFVAWGEYMRVRFNDDHAKISIKLGRDTIEDINEKNGFAGAPDKIQFTYKQKENIDALRTSLEHFCNCITDVMLGAFKN